LSINTYAQHERTGYVTHKSTWNYQDSIYDFNSVSGIAFKFQKVLNHSNNKSYLEIGKIFEKGSLYTYYEIEEVVTSEDTKDVILICVDYFNNRIGFKFNEDRFVVMFNFDTKYGDHGVWQSYYIGEFIKTK
jgi:hypothetical protein